MGINNKVLPALQRKQKDHNGRLFVRETAQTCDIYHQVYPSCLPLSLTQVYYNSFAVRVQRKNNNSCSCFRNNFLMLHERGKRIETDNKKQLKMEGVQREAKK